jgi:putative transposase
MSQEPIFRPFDPEGEVRVYVRNLPHWRQPGATYFVTFRQDDSIPKYVLAEWLDIRQRWYRAHGLDPRWQDSDPERFSTAYSAIPEGIRRAFEREQARMLHEELDKCHGSCVLRHAEPRKCVSDSLRHFHGNRLWMGDFVVMPNHVHALLIPFEGSPELEDLLGSIKKWTSRLIGLWLLDQPVAVRPRGPTHTKPRFWQHESYDRVIRDAEELTIFRCYIARNPEEAGLSADEFDYHVAPWLDTFATRPEPVSETRVCP